MASQDWFEKDFYAVLGVPVDASADAIKKAYRKLARKHHPDANSGATASETRFKEIGEAYGVLSDPEQRQQYDAVRAMARGGARFTAGGPNGGAAGFDDVFGGLFGGGAGAGGGQRVRYSTGGQGGAGPVNLEDLFGGIFGGGGGPQTGGPGMGFRAPRGTAKGADLTAEVTLTFRQAVDGSQLSLVVDDPRTGQRTINARVPAGVREGQQIRLRGKGRGSDSGGEPGDLLVTVHVEPHPVFTLDGEDLRLTLPVTFDEAALGAEVDVPTLDGGTVRLKVPAGTPSGRTLRIKGRGFSGVRRTGDLLVTVQVAVPQRLDGAAREALEAYAKATTSHHPRAELFERAAGYRAGREGGS